MMSFDEGSDRVVLVAVMVAVVVLYKGTSIIAGDCHCNTTHTMWDLNNNNMVVGVEEVMEINTRSTMV